MKTKKEILRILEQVKEGISPRYKVKRIGLFGSFVRGEGREGSDIDILAEFERGADLFDLMGLSLFLEEILGQKVDIVSEGALREELREGILGEVAYI